MSQNQQLFLLANIVSVNTTANTLTFTSNSNIATSFNVGAYGNTTTGGFSANSSVIAVGNSSVNVVVNSSSVYVSGVALGAGGGTNVAAQYAWTNTQSFSNTITFTGSILANTVNAASVSVGSSWTANTTGVYHTGTINAASHTVGTSFIANTTQLTTTYPTVHTANVTVNGAIIANATSGTAGQVLTSAGTGNVYWSTASGGGFSNGASISVANLAITGSVTANGSVGTSGQALVSTGTGVQWGALSPGYNYSSQFNGSNYLTNLSNSTTLQMGSGDFTIEFWMYPTTIAALVIFDGRPAGAGQSGNGALQIGLQLNGSIIVIGLLNAQNTLCTSSAGTIVANQWYHIALVRSGSSTGNVKLYINGVLSSTYGSADTTNYNQGYINIACRFDSALPYAGFLSNWRMVKGTAVYTAAFTPPTSPLSAISGTSLLTCNAITPTSDSSTNNFAITNNGAVTTTATLSPFTSTTVSIPTQSLTAVRQQFTGDGSTTTFAVAGGYTPNAISVFVNGVLLRNGTEVTVTNGSTVVFAIAPLSGALIDVIGTVPTTYSSITPVSYSALLNGSQTLTVPSNTAFGYGTGDFTIEFWAYFNSVATNTIVSNLQTTAGIQPHLYLTAGAALAYYTNGTVSITGSVVNTGVWYHIALVRIGGSTKLYLNGTQTGSTYTDTNNYGTTNPLVVGDYYTSGSTLGGANRLNGYISNFRVVKGVGVYTNNFTVPSSPLAITQSASGAYIQAITGTQTSLLTCNGPTIIDGSTNAFTITNNGTATVSTAIVPTFTNVTITGYTAPYTANYLIVAGGGGGGVSGGGGGGGGMIVGATSLTSGQTYSITVGAGGAGATAYAVSATNGANSVFNSITAIGGGYGANDDSSVGGAGGNGGSGGGAGRSASVVYRGGFSVYGQGNPGGINSITSVYPSGGGGGAGAVGGNGVGGSTSGNGGAGGLSYITGSAVFYAGGGGGGLISATTAGTGGSGGGGNGSNSGNGTAGTTNTGGGGGGANQTVGSVGGSGGSGIVILSVPTTNYTSRTTGSPTVTTSGSQTIISFTASGTYTA
jgi:hypothetical protein